MVVEKEDLGIRVDAAGARQLLSTAVRAILEGFRRTDSTLKTCKGLDLSETLQLQ